MEQCGGEWCNEKKIIVTYKDPDCIILKNLLYLIFMKKKKSLTLVGCCNNKIVMLYWHLIVYYLNTNSSYSLILSKYELFFQTQSANCMVVGEDFVFIGCADGIVRCFSPHTMQFITTLPRTHYLGLVFFVFFAANNEEPSNYHFFVT